MDYKNGKIYKITDLAYTVQYIGSTTQTLSRRFSKHKAGYKIWQDNNLKKYTVYDIFDQFGIENCKIELIEAFPCNNRDELERKEGEFIKDNDCINKIIVGRTRAEYRIDNKNKIAEYYVNNKNKVLEKQKLYRIDNKNKIAEKNKQYYVDNKNKIVENNKLYRIANKNKMADYCKQKIMCECGREYGISCKSNHNKSKFHVKFIESKN